MVLWPNKTFWEYQYYPSAVEEEMFWDSLEFSVSWQKWHLYCCSMLLCRGFSSISEWKRLQELLWGESNASWQWIVPIDSDTLNHFLFTEPHACTLFCFFPMCLRCIHDLQHIFCWNEVNPCQIKIYATSKVFQTGLNDLSAGEKS